MGRKIAAPAVPPLVAGIAREACTCVTLRTVPKVPNKAHGGAPYVQCAACQAWSEGWVLCEGERRYRVQRWLAVHDKALREKE